MCVYFLLRLLHRSNRFSAIHLKSTKPEQIPLDYTFFPRSLVGKFDEANLGEGVKRRGKHELH